MALTVKRSPRMGNPHKIENEGENLDGKPQVVGHPGLLIDHEADDRVAPKLEFTEKWSTASSHDGVT